MANFMRLVRIPYENGGTIATLQNHLARVIPHQRAIEIPVQLCFQRQGLGWRSPIARQQAQRQQDSPQRLAQHYLEALVQLSVAEEAGWPYQAIATAQGWLEFFLVPEALGMWLDALLTRLHHLEQSTQPLAPVPFGFQYLHARCQTLTTLAATTLPHHAPQWQFAAITLTPWEQLLLEAIAAFAVSLERNAGQHRRLQQVEQAFWQWQQHCPLFAFLRTELSRGLHYWQWLHYLQQIFALCLHRYYHVAAIAEL